jgi:hypothetical protein
MTIDERRRELAALEARRERLDIGATNELMRMDQQRANYIQSYEHDRLELDSLIGDQIRAIEAEEVAAEETMRRAARVFNDAATVQIGRWAALG